MAHELAQRSLHLLSQSVSRSEHVSQHAKWHKKGIQYQQKKFRFEGQLIPFSRSLVSNRVQHNLAVGMSYKLRDINISAFSLFRILSSSCELT